MCYVYMHKDQIKNMYMSKQSMHDDKDQTSNICIYIRTNLTNFQDQIENMTHIGLNLIFIYLSFNSTHSTTRYWLFHIMFFYLKEYEDKNIYTYCLLEGYENLFLDMLYVNVISSCFKQALLMNKDEYIIFS